MDLVTLALALKNGRGSGAFVPPAVSGDAGKTLVAGQNGWEKQLPATEIEELHGTITDITDDTFRLTITDSPAWVIDALNSGKLIMLTAVYNFWGQRYEYRIPVVNETKDGVYKFMVIVLIGGNGAFVANGTVTENACNVTATSYKAFYPVIGGANNGKVLTAYNGMAAWRDPTGMTADEVTDAISDAVGGIVRFEYYLCGSGEYDAQTGVPTVASPDTNHIYLVPTAGTNLNMYAYISGAFTFLGTTEVDLSNYVTRADLAQAVPEKVSALENDAGYITNPRTVYASIDRPEWIEESDPTSWVEDATVNAASNEATATERDGIIAAASATADIFVNSPLYQTDKVITPDGQGGGNMYLIGYNLTGGGDSLLGLRRVDTTKGCWGVILAPEAESASGYTLIVVATEDFSEPTVWKLFGEGQYLTEHQSLQGLATETWVNTALGNKMDLQVIDAKPISGSGNLITSGGVYTELNKKADKTAITNMVKGADKAYTIVVSNSAPAAGTADNIITIVV